MEYNYSYGIHYRYRGYYVCARNQREMDAECERIDALIVTNAMRAAKREHEKRMCATWRELDAFYGAYHETSMNDIIDAYAEYKSCNEWN